MKKLVANKIIEVFGIYVGVDLFPVIDATNVIIFKIKTKYEL